VFRVHCPMKFMRSSNHMAIPWRAPKQLANLMKKIQPDIVHLQHPFLLGVAGLASARALGIPVVFTYHTMYEKYAHYVPLFGELAAPFILRKVLKFCAQVDGIVVPSNGMQEMLQAHRIPVPMAVIPSGLRSQFLDSRRNFSAPVAHRPFRLLYVGRLTKEKNIPFLLDMFAKLPLGKYSLMLVGYGAEASICKKYAFEKLRLDPHYVQFVEKPNNLVELYAQSDLFVFPSQTDTQGIVLAESLSQGTPIIALDGCGQRDAIIEGQNGYIVQNQAAMIATIERIAADPEMHVALCRGARESAARYAPGIVIDRLINFYRQTLDAL
jgi:1,2-diacylglycerol 3-alpha-glucosyltransferase